MMSSDKYVNEVPHKKLKILKDKNTNDKLSEDFSNKINYIS